MQRASVAATSFFVAVFIICVSIVAALNFRPLYYICADKLDIPETTGYSYEKIKQNYDTLISYNSIFGEEKLMLSGLPMSYEGEIHFAEVKRIFVGIEIAMYVSAAASAICAVYCIRKKRYSFLRSAGLTALILPAAVGTAAAFFWDETFTLFHELAFSNDYWIMNPITDPIVTILPEPFFAGCVALIAALIVIFSAVCFAAYIALSKKVRTEKAV